MDCERSHWSARVVLMKAWIELQQTLIQRELRAPLRNVYRAISDIGALGIWGSKALTAARCAKDNSVAPQF